MGFRQKLQDLTWREERRAILGFVCLYERLFEIFFICNILVRLGIVLILETRD